MSTQQREPTPEERLKQNVVAKSHPDIRDFYNKTGLEYTLSASDRLAAFFDSTADPDNYTIKVNTLYRIKKGAKEYLWWYETHSSVNDLGNEISKFIIRGKHEKPIGSYVYDVGSSGRVCTGISRLDTEYDIEFSERLIDEMINKEQIDENTRFAIGSLDRKYSVESSDDFKSMSFDDLLYWSKTGNKPEQKKQQKKND